MTRTTTAIALVACLAAGCARQAASPSSAPAPSPAPESRTPVKLVLTEGQAQATAGDAKAGKATVVKWSVSFRLAGKPDPDEAFVFTAGGGSKTVLGKDLSAATPVEGESVVDGQPPREITIEVRRSKAKGTPDDPHVVGGPLVVPVK